MKKIIGTLLLLFPLVCLSQTNFQPGMIVLHQGDTVRGFIDYREWTQNPKEVTFKQSLTADLKKLTEKEISYFEVLSNESYRLAVIPLSMDKVELPDLAVGADSTKITAAVFLRIIEKGKNVTLLSYRDDIKTRFFIERPNEKTMEELTFKRFYTDDRKQQVSTENLYKGQLLRAAESASVSITTGLRQKISKTLYTLSSLSSVVRTINGEAPTARVAPGRFFAGLLFSQNHTSYKGENVLAQGTTAVYRVPGVTAGFDLFLNPRTQKLLLRNELTISTNKAVIENDETYRTTSHAFQQFLVALSPQIVNNAYNSRNLKVNIGAGLSGTFAATSNNFYRVDYQQEGSGYADTEKEDFIELKKFWFAMPIRCGIVFRNRFEVSAQYILPISSMSGYSAFSINRSSMNIGFNWLFAKTR